MMVLKRVTLRIPDLPDLFTHYLEEYIAFYFEMRKDQFPTDGFELFREVDNVSIRISNENLMNDFIGVQISQIPLIMNYFEKEYEDKLVLRFLVKCVTNIKLSQVLAHARGAFTRDYYEQVLNDKVLPLIKSYIDFYSKQLDVDYDRKYSHKKKDVERSAEITLNFENSDADKYYEGFNLYMRRIMPSEKDFTLFFLELEGQKKVSSQRYELDNFHLQELCDVFNYMNKKAIITGDLKVIALWLLRKFYTIKNGEKVDISTKGTLIRYLKGKEFRTNIIKEYFQ